MTTPETDIPHLSGKKCANKTCVRCGASRPTSEFRANPKMRDGLHSWCKGCTVARTRQWREDNPEKVALSNERRRVLGEDGFYTKVCVTCGAEFQTRRKHRQLCGSSSCRDLGLDPEAARVRRRNKNHVRRLRIVAPGVDRLTVSDLRRLLDVATDCPLCGVEMTEQHLDSTHKHIDHIVPLFVGGQHTLGNVRIICRACNLSRPNDGSDL